MLKRGLMALRRHPGLWIPAGLSLALGLASALAAFSLLRTYHWAPLPIPSGERLVAVSKDIPDPSLSVDEYRLLQENARSFEGIAARRRIPFALDLKAADGRRPVRVLPVTPSYFRVLGSPSRLGSGFLELGGRDPGAPVPVILSPDIWKGRFQAAPDVIGMRVLIQDVRCQVVGVASDTFGLLDRQVDVWMARDFGLQADAPSKTRGLVAVARLRPSVGKIQAQRELETLLGRAERRGEGPSLIQLEGLKNAVLRGLFTGESITARLELLLALLALLLTAGSANAALLLLLHRVRQSPDLAIRRALGESRIRHLAASAIEGVLLAVVGAAAGTAICQAAFQFLDAADAISLPLVRQSGMIGFAEVLFVLGLTTALGLLLGLSAGLLTLGLRNAPRNLHAGHRTRLPLFKRPLAVLNMLHVSVSTVLTISTVLLLHSALRSVLDATGLQAEGVFKVDLRLPDSRYFERVPGEVRFSGYDEVIRPELWVYLEQLERNLSATPGVEEVAVTADPDWEMPRYFKLPGQETLEFRDLPKVQRAVYRPIGPNYFELLRIPILRGRSFGRRDARSDPPVAIIDENLARRWWPGRNPVGDSVTILDDAPSGPRRLIVGIAANARIRPEQSLAEPTIYIPYLQLPGDNPTLLGMQRRFVSILLRSGSAGPSLPMQKIIRDVDEDVLLGGTQPLQEFLTSPWLSRRFYVLMMGGLTAAAITLSAVGLSAATLYLLQARRREIGLRAALGASPWSALARALQEQALVVLGGLAIGAAGAVFLSDSLRLILGGVSADLPLLYAGAMCGLALVGLAATFLAAGRSLRLDPSEVLKASD